MYDIFRQVVNKLNYSSLSMVYQYNHEFTITIPYSVTSFNILYLINVFSRSEKTLIIYKLLYYIIFSLLVCMRVCSCVWRSFYQYNLCWELKRIEAPWYFVIHTRAVYDWAFHFRGYLLYIYYWSPVCTEIGFSWELVPVLMYISNVRIERES